MANNNLGRYKAEITADTRKYRKELGGAEKSSKSFKSSASAMSSAVAAIDGPFGGISSRISALTSLATAGGLAVGLFAGSIAGLGAVTLATTGHMAKLEVATAKTSALLKATGGASGYTAQQLDVMARSVALNTLASAEGIRNAQNSLLTFKSISGPVFERTIVLAQDMAAVFGGDAKSSALQLGKALEDPITGLIALRRVGVTFTEQQKDQIKAMVKVGNAAEAQRLILSELEHQIGGAGAAEASGLSGATDTLAQSWEELLEAWDKTTDSTSKAQEGVNLLSSALNGLRTSFNPTDHERLNELVLERKELEGDIAEIQSSSFKKYSGQGFKLKGLQKEKAEVIQEIQEIQDRRIAEIKEGNAAQIKADELTKERLAESNKAAETKRLDDLKTALTKEVDAVAASLLSKEEKENAYHQKRIAALDKLASIDPDKAESIDGFKTAEYERHINEVARLDAEALEKKTEADIAEYEATLINNDSHLLLYQEFQEKQTEIADEETKKRTDLEKKAQSAVASLHQSTWQEAANFLGVFAGKSKAAAIASIAISKGLAIAQTMAHTQTASMLAFSSQLIPGDPSSIARAAAAAASVESLGAVKVGLIAATGLAQAYQVSSGDAGNSNYGAPGTSAPDAYQPTVSLNDGSSDNRQGVQIIFTGDVNGIDAEHIADTLKDHLDNTDFVLVEPSSRNGQILAA